MTSRQHFRCAAVDKSLSLCCLSACNEPDCKLYIQLTLQGVFSALNEEGCLVLVCCSLSSHVYEEAVLLSQRVTYQHHKICPTACTMPLLATLVLQASNPFMFKHVTHLKSSQHLDDIGPCVVMATPSMLQSGLSRYFTAQTLVTVHKQTNDAEWVDWGEECEFGQFTSTAEMWVYCEASLVARLQMMAAAADVMLLCCCDAI